MTVLGFAPGIALLFALGRPVPAMAAPLLTGRVTDLRDAPIANATVTLRGKHWSAHTDSSGRYSLGDGTTRVTGKPAVSERRPDGRGSEVFAADGRWLPAPGDEARRLPAYRWAPRTGAATATDAAGGPGAAAGPFAGVAGPSPKRAAMGWDTLVFTAPGKKGFALPITLSAGNYDMRLAPLDLPPRDGMVFVPGGRFQMGEAGLPKPVGYAEPVHPTEVSAFQIDTVEVTQARFQAVLGKNPSVRKDPAMPVTNITWFDAVLFCNARSKAEGLDTVYRYTAVTGSPGEGATALAGLALDSGKRGYRLPTEAEWEFACRGMTRTSFYWGDAMDGDYCWNGDNSGLQLHAVALKKPNPFGLYDMSGNVWERVQDWAGEYGTGLAVDPTGPATGVNRMLRGGSFHGGDPLDYRWRSAARDGISTPQLRDANLGFRCVFPVR